MIHYVFDLDDTLIIHKNYNQHIHHYNWINKDNELIYYFNRFKGPKYIYTNGTSGHALKALEKLELTDHFDKIYSRDTIDYMKPDQKSIYDVHDDILKRDTESKVIIFFDDILENLQMAHKMGWYTIWIHPKYSTQSDYKYINLAFPNIKSALSFLEKRI